MMRSLLIELKNKGKKIFVATNLHAEYVDLVLKITLGNEW